MITASYAGRILARARDTIFLEGNDYFPRETVDKAAIQSVQR